MALPKQSARRCGEWEEVRVESGEFQDQGIDEKLATSWREASEV